VTTNTENNAFACPLTFYEVVCTFIGYWTMMTTIVFVHEGLDGMGSPLETLLYCDVHVVINYDLMSWMVVATLGNDAI
jgi:hypothetical protein